MACYRPQDISRWKASLSPWGSLGARVDTRSILGRVPFNVVDHQDIDRAFAGFLWLEN
jgi:hypothetical protein